MLAVIEAQGSLSLSANQLVDRIIVPSSRQIDLFVRCLYSFGLGSTFYVQDPAESNEYSPVMQHLATGVLITHIL